MGFKFTVACNLNALSAPQPAREKPAVSKLDCLIMMTVRRELSSVCDVSYPACICQKVLQSPRLVEAVHLHLPVTSLLWVCRRLLQNLVLVAISPSVMRRTNGRMYNRILLKKKHKKSPFVKPRKSKTIYLNYFSDPDTAIWATSSRLYLRCISQHFSWNPMHVFYVFVFGAEGWRGRINSNEHCWLKKNAGNWRLSLRLTT